MAAETGSRPESAERAAPEQQAAAAESAASKPVPAMFRGKLLFWLPWPLLVVLDLWSKAAVFDWMVERYGSLRGEYLVFETAPISLRFVTWENTGTIWGLFQDGTVALMVLRCAAVAGLLWFVRATAAAARFQMVVLSLIFAGAIGNLYDNFVRTDAESPRSVRDFMRFTGELPMEWGYPAFNVADSCITVGAIGLLLLLLREDRAAAKAAREVSS